jgi:diadenosine tetraphosphate (Ap4A) HIT family hydrolase
MTPARGRAPNHAGPCELCAACDPDVTTCALGDLTRPGQSWIVCHDRIATVIPTVGPLRAGHVLVVPHRHVTSLGRLSVTELDALEGTVAAARHLLQSAYGEGAVAFEYGFNVPGGRRVEHAHLHIVPTTSTRLYDHVAQELQGTPIRRLTELPPRPDWSYVFLETHVGDRHVFPVPNDAEPRLRLRDILAPALGPDADGDWERSPRADLIQQTVDDLTATAPHGVGNVASRLVP